MIIWLDAHLAPSLAPWLRAAFEDVDATAIRDLGLLHAEDEEIFDAARRAEGVVMTKDGDFAGLVERLGPPPQVIWIRCGNTSKARMREILTTRLSEVLDLIQRGEPLVEIICD